MMSSINSFITGCSVSPEAETINYVEIKRKALLQLQRGENPFEAGGAFVPILKTFLKEALEVLMHTNSQETVIGNDELHCCTMPDNLLSINGQISVDYINNKHLIELQRNSLPNNCFQMKILELYKARYSLAKISQKIYNIYSINISPEEISAVTDQLNPVINEWQNRTLEPVYCLLRSDKILYKIKDLCGVQNYWAYNLLGITTDGKKDILGSYQLEKGEENVWTRILPDLQQRGVKDILLACVDNPKGFSESAATFFPNVSMQNDIINQITTSLKYVISRDQKPFMKDLKKIYCAENIQIAENNLKKLEAVWGDKYSVAINLWKNNRKELETYFSFPFAIRRIIYNTNMVEDFHRHICNLTKSKGVFESSSDFQKLLYLCVREISQKWKMSLANWSLTLSELTVLFGDRIAKGLDCI